jgi:hypothetical protein
MSQHLYPPKKGPVPQNRRWVGLRPVPDTYEKREKKSLFFFTRDKSPFLGYLANSLVITYDLGNLL